MFQKMLKVVGLFLAVLIMLQSGYCASEDIQDDEESEVTSSSHEVVDSFPSSRMTYHNAAHHQYPWRLWNFPYYQPRTPQIPFAGSGGLSPPMADPRFVTNRCNTARQPTTTTYPCWTTTVTSTTTTIVTTTVYPTTTTPYTTTTDTTTTAVTTSSTPTTPPTSSTDSSTTGTTGTSTYSTTTPPLAVLG